MRLQLDVWGKGGVVTFGQAEEFHLKVLALIPVRVFTVDAPESAGGAHVHFVARLRYVAGMF